MVRQKLPNRPDTTAPEMVDVVHRAVAVADVDQRAQHVDDVGGVALLLDERLGEVVAAAAEVQRAMGFENEKDHPEVGPSQFEMNFKYASALIAADRIQLYKLLCRQVAQSMDMTASFLPKPITTEDVLDATYEEGQAMYRYLNPEIEENFGQWLVIALQHGDV